MSLVRGEGGITVPQLFVEPMLGGDQNLCALLSRQSISYDAFPQLCV